MLLSQRLQRLGAGGTSCSLRPTASTSASEGEAEEVHVAPDPISSGVGHGRPAALWAEEGCGAAAAAEPSAAACAPSVAVSGMSMVPCTYPNEDSLPASDCASSPFHAEPQRQRNPRWGVAREQGACSSEQAAAAGDPVPPAAGLHVYHDAVSRCAWEAKPVAAHVNSALLGRPRNRPDGELLRHKADGPDEGGECAGGAAGGGEGLGPGCRILRGMPPRAPPLQQQQQPVQGCGRSGEAAGQRQAAPARVDACSPTPQAEQQRMRQPTLMQFWRRVAP